MSEPTRKRILVLLRKAPHGSIFGEEALQAVLIAGAFEQDVTVLLAGDAVFHLVDDQQPEIIGHSDVPAMFHSLEDYDVERVVVEERALAQRGLTTEDLIMKVDTVDARGLAELIDGQDIVLSF